MSRFLYCAGMYLTIAALMVTMIIVAFAVRALIRFFAAEAKLGAIRELAEEAPEVDSALALKIMDGEP